MYLLFGIICRHVSKGEAGGAYAPSDFGRSEGAAAAAAPRLTSRPPRFLDFDTRLICQQQFLTSVLYRPSHGRLYRDVHGLVYIGIHVSNLTMGSCL